MKCWLLIFSITLVSACSTNIHAKDETIVPPTVRFGAYQTYVMEPLKVEHSEEDSGDIAAAKRIDTELSTCIVDALPSKSGGKKLRIVPTITDLKKVDSAERVLLGAMAGSSAVLLNMKYIDAQTNTVIANPTFYAKAAAMGGAFSFGGTDNAMLTRVTKNACDYSRKYR